jgi:hypothetical protein
MWWLHKGDLDGGLLHWGLEKDMSRMAMEMESLSRSTGTLKTAFIFTGAP